MPSESHLHPPNTTARTCGERKESGRSPEQDHHSSIHHAWVFCACREGREPTQNHNTKELRGAGEGGLLHERQLQRGPPNTTDQEGAGEGGLLRFINRSYRGGLPTGMFLIVYKLQVAVTITIAVLFAPDSPRCG